MGVLRELRRRLSHSKDRKEPNESPSLVPPSCSAGAVTLSVKTEDDYHPSQSSPSARKSSRESSRNSLMEWLRDVLPSPRRASSKESRRSDSPSPGGARSGSQRSFRSPFSKRPPAVRWADDAPMTAAEMASVAHQETMLRKQPEPSPRFSGSKSSMRQSMLRRCSSVTLLSKRASRLSLSAARQSAGLDHLPAAAAAGAPAASARASSSAKGRASHTGAQSCNGAL
mmetsp:Transcript_52029/g.116813  ORF Transcript_52029/g.116813 Transcript_52029/m.116813 type:complete len:227 (-) Transcript_52029:274-954(-)